MYYPDLTCYRIDSCSKVSTVYPKLKNIGWLDAEIDFKKGGIAAHLIKKLKEILFLHVRNIEDKENSIFDESKAILVHTGFSRGSAYQCPLCEERKDISVEPTNLQYYNGGKSILLGINEIQIPSMVKDEYYIFPTMAYHYIVEHEYIPPKEFLDALELFDLNQPFNIYKECADEVEIDMPESEVNSFIPENGFSNYEKHSDEEYDES